MEMSSEFEMWVRHTSEGDQQTAGSLKRILPFWRHRLRNYAWVGIGSLQGAMKITVEWENKNTGWLSFATERAKGAKAGVHPG